MSDADKDTQNAQGTSEGAEGTNDTNDDTKNAQGATGTPEGASSSASNDDVVPRSEVEKLDARMRAADKRASEAEEKLKQIEREKMSEAEKVAAELKDVSTERDSLKAELNDVKLENAFLSNNKHTWHDPQDALRLLDMDGVEIRDGKVIGLAEAVDKLAKAKPHLLKRDDDGDGKGSSAASGNANNGRRKGDKQEPPRNYSARFPALRQTAGKASK